MIEAYVANLAWLNMGYAGLERLTLPADFEAAQAILERLGLADGAHDLVFTEYRADIPGLASCLSPYENLDELNHLAALLSELDDAGREKFAAAVEHGEYNGTVEDLINLAGNLDCYDLYPEVRNAEDLGRLRAEGRLSLPEDCRFYFDYAAYGEDTSINEGGVFSHAGYIHNNRSEFIRHYDGRNTPEEYRLFARPDQERPPSERSDDTVANAKTATPPLLDNEHVKELLSILQENQSPGMKDLFSIIGYVGAMEQQLEKAVGELAAMRQELQAMQEERHPLKNALQNAVHAMEKSVANLRERIDDLKQGIVDGCQKAVAAFKEKGVSALDNLARFFHVKPALTAIRNSLDQDIKADEKLIANIEAASAEYHKMGLHLKNVGRALIGKEPLEDAKSVGKLAKAIEKPIKGDIACLRAMRGSVDKALGSIGRLEQAAQKKPSIVGEMRKLQEQIAQAPQRPVRPGPPE